MKIGLIGRGRWGINIERTLIELGLEVMVANSAFETRRLKMNELDGVCVATPGSTHAKVALPFVLAGIPVFIEKPLVTSLSDLELLEQAKLEATGNIFVGHIHLYNPAYIKARELARAMPKILQLEFEGMNFGPIRDDMSALWDWAPHDVVMALDLLEAKPTKVQAWGEKLLRPETDLYDVVKIRLIFSDQLSVLINVSWLNPVKQKRMTVIGRKSAVVFDDVAEEKVRLYQPMGEKPTYPKYDNESPLALELTAFLEMVKTGQTPLASFEQGTEVVRILAAAEQSIRLDGKLIDL